MEHRSEQREGLFKEIDKISQEILKLKNNLTEILDYIDLRRKETDEGANQQQNLIDGLFKEIDELEKILEEKKRNLSASKEVQERYLRFANALSSMEQSVLDEYQQTLNDIDKNITPSVNLELITPSYKKKIIEDYLSKEKLPSELLGNILKIDNFGMEEIYDDKGTLACVFYKSYHGDLILSSDVLMKYMSDNANEISLLYLDYCKAKAQGKEIAGGFEPSDSSAFAEGGEAGEPDEKESANINLINQGREHLLKLLSGLKNRESLPGTHTNYAFENSTLEILNENTISDLQNQFELGFDQFFDKDKGLSQLRDLVDKYRDYREGLGEERYLDFLLQQLGYPNTRQNI
jgi:hypothetical protein